MNAKIFWTIVITGGLGGALAAQAQVNSPFAVKKKKQAWETQDLVPEVAAPQTQTPPVLQQNLNSAPVPQSFNNPQSSGVQYYQAPTVEVPAAQNPPRSPFAPKTPPRYENTSANSSAYNAPNIQAPSFQAPSFQGQAYSPQTYQSQDPRLQNYQAQNYQGQNYQGQNYQGQGYQGQGYPNGAQNGPFGQSQIPQSAPPRSWKDRLGLGNIATSLKGFLKLGAAAVRRERDGPQGNEWDDGYIADGQIRGEISAITQGGLEYGIGGLIRGQYDEFRRGFGGRVGDCPPELAGCASVDVAGVPTAIRGHTSRFYTSGPSDARKTDIALEGAYVFLRSSYGDLSVGRDDGAAYLFSLGAPSLVAVNASNSSVDYTGLDSVKTVNDASGFAEKITYTSPRLLGDRIGVGVQFGASYSPNARACGVDYCVRRNGADATGVLAAELEDVVEFGVSLDRNFGNGFSAELTGTYARASEQSNLAAFDDLESFGAGAEFKYNDLTLGGSWLKSNNALEDGDYEAWDIGLSWKPAQWGVSLSYGHADDESVDLTSDQITLGAIYEFNDRFSLGTGIQYVDRNSPFVIGGTITQQDEKAYGLFVEGKVTF